MTKKSGKGLIAALIIVGVLLVAAVTVLVLFLSGVFGKKEKLYHVYLNDREKGEYAEGSRVTIDYSIHTDTDYGFYCEEVDLTESYRNGRISLKFVMPAEDVYIEVEEKAGMEAPPAGSPDPSQFGQSDDEPDQAAADFSEIAGTWYDAHGTSEVTLTVEADGSFVWTGMMTGYLQYADGAADWGIPGMITGPRYEMYRENGTFADYALRPDGEEMTLLDGGGAWLLTRERPDVYQMGAGGVIDMYGGQFQNEFAGVSATIWEQSTGIVFAFGIEDASFIGDATFDEQNDRLMFDAKSYATGTEVSGYVELEGDSIRVTFTSSDYQWIGTGDVYTLPRVY